MLYKSNNDIYVFANNKYYKLEVVRDSLVPVKGTQAKYKLDNKFEIEFKDAMEFLKKDKRGSRIE